MNILIINMPIREHAKPNNVPIGIYYLKRIINKKHTVRVLDLNSYRPLLNIKELKGLDEHYDLILFSGLITTYQYQKDLCKMFKRTRVVSGGGLASNLGMTLLDFIPFDGICIGEGEKHINKIVHDPLIRVYKDKCVEDLDNIPFPDWDNVHNIETYISNPIWGSDSKNSSYIPYKMKRSLNIITSRGCPYKCSFCNKDITGGNNYRERSAENIYEEVKYLKKKYDIDFVGFVDDNFAVNKRRLMKICEYMTKLKIRWGGHARFNNVDDYILLKHMARHGCVYLGFGGESGNQEILNDMNKGNKIEQMKEVIGWCREAGIHPNCTWMAGWIGETKEQLKDTINFIYDYAPENEKLFIATAYPNTPFYNRVKHLILDKYSFEGYLKKLGDADKLLVNYSSMTDKELHENIAL